MLILPGLIDSHVHLREPGATQKEDFETGTKAAIAGGYTTVLDMPNNPEPTISQEALDKKIKLTSKRIYAEVGFHFGATTDSIEYFDTIKDKVFGLKVYMNHTTGTLLIEDKENLEDIFVQWPKNKVLMVHAEGPTLKTAIAFARRNGNKLHVCHVGLANEISMIKKAKDDGLSITCETTCHHLFLTEKDAKSLGPFGMMRPPLVTKADQEALWTGIADGTVDLIASDHAPHTKEEKYSPNPPNGVPGLETTLPLLLTAVNDGKLTMDDIIRLCHTNPAKIFNIPHQPDTHVEVDPDKRYTISDKRLYTKCGWTPFAGKSVIGRVKKVVLRGKVVYDNGQIVGNPQGKVIYPKT